MGSQIEKFFESNEKNEDIVNDSNNDDNNNQLNEQFNDFKFIQFYKSTGNQDNFNWSVAHVRSLLTNKEYAMKKIQGIQQLQLQYYNEEMNVLRNLDLPYIIKYYNLFVYNNDCYLVMEYMNNSDIENFINVNKLYEYDPEEEIILKIILQCATALTSCNQKIENKGIFRLSNILMDNDQNIKISLFNTKMNDNYSFKDDINYLGDLFHQICFVKERERFCPKEKYSKDLITLINSMREKDIIKRWNSEKLLNEVKEIYFKKYVKNTSIISVLRCLYSFPDLNDIIFQRIGIIKKNQNKNYLHNQYIKIIELLSGIEKGDINKIIHELRFNISSNYSKFQGHNEVNPFYFLIFILENMYKESNKLNIISNRQNDQEGQEIIDSVFNVDQIDKLNKEQMLRKFKNKYSNNVNSYIANLFCGIVLTEIKCDLCDTIKYSFNNFCFLYYDLSKRKNEDFFDLIKDGFENDKLTRLEKKLYCEQCLIYQKHFEYNKYYKMPRHLIIYFNRGKKYEHTSNVNFEENLNLTNFIEENNESYKEYYLVGSINRRKNEDKEEFIFYSRDKDNKNIWYISNMNDSKNFDNAPVKEIQSDGKVIMLFYNYKKK